MIFIGKNNKQTNFSEQELQFLNNFSSIEDAINFCNAQSIVFSEESNKLKKIKERLDRRSLGKLEGFEHRNPNVASMPIISPEAALYNKYIVSHDGLTPYEKSEEADAILSHGFRRSGLGSIIGAGAGAIAGAGLGLIMAPNRTELAVPFGLTGAGIGLGVGGLTGGWIGAHKGAEVAKKRREELLKVLTKKE